MSLELVSSLVSVLGASSASAALASAIYEALKKRLVEKGVTDVKPADIADVASLEGKVGNRLSEREEEDVTREALSAAYGAASALRTERMRQAKITFNAAIVLLVLGVLIIFVGVALMLFRGAVTEGAITTGVGAIAEIVSALLFKFNNDTNNRLDEIGRYLSSVEAAQVAMNLIARIEDSGKRDDAIREAARTLAGFSTAK